MQPIYLDNNATTIIAPEVLDAMIPYFTLKYGNASSSSHAFGWEAAKAVDEARLTLAKLIGAKQKEEIIYTSGATESNNLAIKGVVLASGKSKAHVITQATEHKCVLDSCAYLETLGHEVTYLGVDETGLIDLKELEKSFRPDTVLCSIMAANNEIGTIQPIREIAALCHKYGVLFHTDAAQAVGRIPINVEKDGIDLMSLSAHKIHGPKGVGALYVRQSPTPAFLTPLLHGGGQERGKRSGTLNVPGIIGMSKAIHLALDLEEEDNRRLLQMRNDFTQSLLLDLPFTFLNGHLTQRLPNNANILFEYVEAEKILTAMPEIACSTGSACSSESREPSYVIKALGRTDAQVKGSLRFGLSRYTTDEEIDITIKKVKEVVTRLREKSLAYEIATK